MLNFIRMELFRLIKTKSFVIAVFAAVCAAAFSAYGFYFEFTEMQNGNIAADTFAGDNSAATGIIINANIDWLNGTVPFHDIVSGILNSGIVLLITAIFVPLYVNAEYKTGYIKNIISKMENRSRLVIPNALGSAAIVVTLIAVTVGSGLLCSAVLFGDVLSLKFSAGFAAFLIIQIILHIGYAVFLQFLCCVSFSGTASLAAGLILSLGMAESAVSTAISALTDNGERILKLLPVYNVRNLNFDASGRSLTQSLLVGVIFTAVCVAGTMATLRKKDIR